MHAKVIQCLVFPRVGPVKIEVFSSTGQITSQDSGNASIAVTRGRRIRMLGAEIESITDRAFTTKVTGTDCDGNLLSSQRTRQSRTSSDPDTVVRSRLSGEVDMGMKFFSGR